MRFVSFSFEQQAFGYQLAAIFLWQGGVEAAGEESDEGEGCVLRGEVSVFHIVQGAIGDMGFELAAQGIIGVVAGGVVVDEQLGEGLEVGDVFFGIDRARDEVVEEILFLFVREVGVEPEEHLEAYLVAFHDLGFASRGGDLGGVGAVVEEGALDVVDLRDAVDVGPHHVVLGREGLGAVAEVVVDHDGAAEHRHDDRATEQHLGFGVLVVLGEVYQRGLGAEELESEATDTHLGMAVEDTYAGLQPVGFGDVVAVHTGHQLGVDDFEAAVEVLGEAHIVREGGDADARVVDGAHHVEGVVRRGVVDHQQLEVAVGLTEDAVDGFLDPGGNIICRHQHGYSRHDLISIRFISQSEWLLNQNENRGKEILYF